jgi:OsmC subfamily peroxiredoxin
MTRVRRSLRRELIPYSFKTRFENKKGTNPEELIAAAHAGCFTMALAFGLQAGGYTPTELTTEAAVTLQPEGQGFRISRSALTLRAQVPNLDEATFVEWLATPRRTVRSRRCLTRRSRWMPSRSEVRSAAVAPRVQMRRIAMVQAHQPGEAVFRSILPEEIDWKPFPAFPLAARLAVRGNSGTYLCVLHSIRPLR